jgi:hypothetical protein
MHPLSDCREDGTTVHCVYAKTEFRRNTLVRVFSFSVFRFFTDFLFDFAHKRSAGPSLSTRAGIKKESSSLSVQRFMEIVALLCN